jgi:hypothetical protein
MPGRLALALLLAAGLAGCVRYEFDHEFWLEVDGSGRVQVTGRPGLWVAFKNVPSAEPEAAAREARRAFERAGLRVRRARVVERRGQRYLFLAAEFRDLNALGRSPAFPDLEIALRPVAGRLELRGAWGPPPGAREPPAADRTGLVAVRFHMPSRVHAHDNAAGGVERGNILSWRATTDAVVSGRVLSFGAEIDSRSTLHTTLVLFGVAVALALLFVAGTLLAVARRGRRLAPPAR